MTTSKLDALGDKGRRPSVLSEAAREILARIEADHMPWQTGYRVVMPTNVMGRQVSNINFLLLAGQGSDARWGTRSDIERIQGSLRAGEKPRTHLIHWWNRAKEDKKGSYPVAIPVYNLSQADHPLPAIAQPDILGTAHQVKRLAANASVHLVYDPADSELYVEDTINVDFDLANENVVGETLFGLAEWARETKHTNKPTEESIRSRLLNVIAGTMLCAEYGLPVPKRVVEEMRQSKAEVVAYLKEHLDEVFRLARAGWEVHQYVSQFAPAPALTEDASLEGVDRPDLRPGRSLFGG